MSEEAAIPKQELLLKLLRMTTSSNDGEALTALRKANDLLNSAGWDWDKLISGKIKVVTVVDPFAGGGSVREVQRGTQSNSPFGRTPQPAPPTPSFRPATTGGSTQTSLKQAPVRSTFANKFPNHCWGCATEVPAYKGFIFKPTEYNPNAVPSPRSMWEVLCSSCNANMQSVSAGRAFVVKKRGRANIGDLA